MTDYQRWRDEFIARVTRLDAKHPTSDMSVAEAQKMMRYATTAHRLAEIACCRDLSPAERKRDDANDLAAITLAKRCGFGLHMQADPRGAIYRLLPPGRTSESDAYEHGIPVPARGYSAAQLERASRGN